ncbi:MAG: hypothetical protein ACRC35_08090 [Angustibacter sp.]
MPATGGFPQTSGKATTVLALGISSLVLLVTCFLSVVAFVPGVIGVTMAGGARREIAASGGRLTGESQVQAGVICSWVTIGLSVLLLIVGIIVFAAGLANSDDVISGASALAVPLSS